MRKNQNALATAASIEETNKREFLEKLKRSLGRVNVVLDELGIEKETFNKWCEDTYFSMKLCEVDDYAGDIVEGLLYKKISEGDTQAILFYCETKLRNRGYYKKT